MSLLEIDRLSVRHGDGVALDDVSLSVDAGEILALVGRSGSGKSTIAVAALGLLPASARIGGAVRIDGADLAAMDERALGRMRGARVGMIFQEPASALNPALTIGRQIGETLACHTALPRRAVRMEVAALLARVGLDVPPDRYPHSLSGGQRQRVCVAIAIAAGPALLIADEPTAALDPQARAGIMALLAGLVRERGMGLLLVTHDLSLAAGIADRLAVLDEGRLVEEGPAAALIAAPCSPVLVAMVAAGRQPPRSPARGGRPVLRLRGVARSYPATGGLFERRRRLALADIDLDLAAGETLAVVGASGSGKTTLARLVLGLDRPDAGVVTVEEQEWRFLKGAALRAARRKMQAVFQDPADSLDPRLSVRWLVAEPLRLLVPRPSAAERAVLVRDALAEVALPAETAARLPHQLSGGQRQRVALARALILKPALIVLDEALSALDPDLRAEMAALLIRLQVAHGLAYLFVSHDMALVRAVASHVLVLREGRIVERGEVGEIMERWRDR